MEKISIIIKALNEEQNIAKCIESSLKALKKVEGDNEIILVDSSSKDKTVDVAKKYPIKIIQLKENWQKSPSAALFIGFLYSKGEYIYILDGDMTLEKDFIKKALFYFKDNKVAGVAGLFKEPYAGNLVSKRYQKVYGNLKTGEVKILNGGGLYKRSIIEKIGGITNPYLYSNEEAYLSYKLINKGYKLFRLQIPAITHYRDKSSALKILTDKWKNKYLLGPGQVLRYSFGKKYFWQHLKRLKLYISVIFWLFIGLISLVLVPLNELFFFIYILITLILLILILLKKRDLKAFFYSLISWHLTSLGIIIGFLKTPINQKNYPTDAIIIKK